VEPAPSEGDDKAIRALLLAAPKYEGPVRDPKWTDSEIRARWLRCAPEPTSKKLEPPVRTEHYIVLADCSNGAAFAKKLEGFHAALKKIVPIPDVSSCKLLPIYLFRTEDEYYEYYVKAFRATRDEAEAQWGHREGIYYVTYFEDLDNPIHLYYAAQQILDERIGLDGGGSWFQAGLAEFASTKPTDRSPAAKKAKNGEHIPLAELIRLPDFGRTTAREEATGVDQVGLRFAEAALVFEFLHESKSLKQRFVPFMQAVGVVEDTDVPGIEAALREVYGTDVAGLEQQWLEYCKKR
jgi:hypothetical protein